MTNIAINGFGRIGRIAFRILSQKENVKVVAINDLVPIEQLAYLLKYDTVHGRFDGKIEIKDSNLVVDGNSIRVTAQSNPETLQWDKVQAEVVLECTGFFKSHEKAAAHLKAGAKKVVISAPSEDAPMYIMGLTTRKYKQMQKLYPMLRVRPIVWQP